ncbi:DEAD/DEAH box helicase [Bacillaceae bacterium S4-13-56]
MSNSEFNNYKLSNEILKALSALGYSSPTKVQQKVIPEALLGHDLIVQSQTGSGKTAAFAIPICEKVDWEENKPQALILSPTRELAAQVAEDFTNIGRFKRIKVTAVYGKQSFAKQQLELKQKVHVVVGTPGRVLDHMEKGTLILDKIEYLVIDEADEMLNMGFIDQVEAIIERLPKNRTTFTFSATLPEDVESLCRKYMQNPNHIQVKASGITTEKINHFVMEVEEADKLSLLKDVLTLENPDSCILFCRTQERVHELFGKLDDWGMSVDQLHGAMVQEDRFAVMNDFKRGAFRFLVATDVAARGIDVDDITHIINYDFPLEKERYVHRTGRTARAGKSGMAITFMTSHEEKFLKEVEEYIGFNIVKREAPTREDVKKAQPDFDQKNNTRPNLKQNKSEKLNQDIMKLYFNGGKKKKLRAIDFVGTIAKIPGVSADDIGIITIQENSTYVDILNGKGPLVLQTMKKTTIKGKQLKVHQARK